MLNAPWQRLSAADGQLRVAMPRFRLQLQMLPIGQVGRGPADVGWWANRCTGCAREGLIVAVEVVVVGGDGGRGGGGGGS